jgi:hypothetical protein
MSTILKLYPLARARARSPVPQSQACPLSPDCQRRVRELGRLTDGLLGLVRLVETRLRAVIRDCDYWRRKAEAIEEVGQ